MFDKQKVEKPHFHRFLNLITQEEAVQNQMLLRKGWLFSSCTRNTASPRGTIPNAGGENKGLEASDRWEH